jgi:hypothetical protein
MRAESNRPRSFGSFGMPAADPEPKDDAGVQPVPVLHVGEVHAELRLHVPDPRSPRVLLARRPGMGRRFCIHTRHGS